MKFNEKSDGSAIDVILISTIYVSMNRPELTTVWFMVKECVSSWFKGIVSGSCQTKGNEIERIYDLVIFKKETLGTNIRYYTRLFFSRGRELLSDTQFQKKSTVRELGVCSKNNPLCYMY